MISVLGASLVLRGLLSLSVGRVYGGPWPSAIHHVRLVLARPNDGEKEEFAERIG